MPDARPHIFPSLLAGPADRHLVIGPYQWPLIPVTVQARDEVTRDLYWLGLHEGCRAVRHIS